MHAGEEACEECRDEVTIGTAVNVVNIVNDVNDVNS